MPHLSLCGSHSFELGRALAVLLLSSFIASSCAMRAALQGGGFQIRSIIPSTLSEVCGASKNRGLPSDSREQQKIMPIVFQVSVVS